MLASDTEGYRVRLKELYQSHYGLRLHSLQIDSRTVPPADIVRKVQGSSKADPTTFLGSGWRNAITVLELLEAHGYDISRMKRVLDFGVGTGRVLRQFLPFSLERHGCDVNPVAVEWTKSSLGEHADIRLTSLEPPLPYNNATFDLVTAFSVFTHTPVAAQPAWIAELRRVTRPGGCVIATVHDFSRIEKDDGSGVKEMGVDRGLHMNAYLTQQKHRDLWSAEFDLLEIRRNQLVGNVVFIARRPSS